MCVCVFVCAHAHLSLEFTTYRDFELVVEGGQLAVQHTYSSVLCMLDHLISFRFLPVTLSCEILQL
jgi:hypothetical protein